MTVLKNAAMMSNLKKSFFMKTVSFEMQKKNIARYKTLKKENMDSISSVLITDKHNEVIKNIKIQEKNKIQ